MTEEEWITVRNLSMVQAAASQIGRLYYQDPVNEREVREISRILMGWEASLYEQSRLAIDNDERSKDSD